jgi:transposase-like protein
MLQYLNYFGEKIMSRKRKTFNAEFKSKVVLELLSGEMTVAQLASKYEITPKSIGD